MESHRKTTSSLARPALLASVIAALCLAVAGCGDDSDSSATLELPPPGGVDESFLAEHPTAALDLTHTAVLHLEASGGGAGDTGSEAGVDEVRCSFDPDTELTLGLGDELTSGTDTPTLVLLDDAGAEIARVSGQERQKTVRVSGAHTLELRHPQAGAADAEPLVLFLHPQRGAGGGSAAATSNDVATLEVGKDCIACDLRGIDLVGDPALVVGDVRLDLANFTGATISIVAFNRTELIGTVFDDVQFFGVLFLNPTLTAASFKGATFLKDPSDTCQGPSCRTSGNDPNCCFRQCQTSFDIFYDDSLQSSGAMNMADFSGAEFNAVCLTAPDLSGTSFAGATFDDASSVASSSFSGSELRGVQFLGTDVRGFDASGASPTSESAAATFVGATGSDGTTGVRFENVDLRGINFELSDLRRSLFTGSLLDEATSFAFADLSDTDFAGVDLSRADLSTAFLSTATSFVGATLSDGTSHGVNLACLLPEGTGGCDFEDQTTQFKGADLAFANLSGVDLAAANLEGTILDNAVLIGANLDLASLKDASLRGARMGVAPGSASAVTQLGGAFMVNVDLTDADLRGANLSGAHLYGDSLLVRTALDSANFTGALCAGAAFSGTLNDTVFNQAVLVNATFNGAVLSNAKFDSAYLQGADFSTATQVTGVTLRNAAVSTTPGFWMFTEQDGTPFTFAFEATMLGALATVGTVICPNNKSGPCTADKLIPVADGPYPPQPPCVPSAQFCFENCLDPPNFSRTPPCG